MARIRRTVEEWRALIDEQEESEQTQKEWCELRGINVGTYRKQVYRLKRQGRENANNKNSQQTENERENQTPSEPLSWVEVSFETKQNEKKGISEESGKICIEADKLRITADSTYPVTALTAVIGEVMKLC